MKKLLIFLFAIILVTGCNKMKSPSNEVEKLFINYNNLNSEVLIQLDSVLETEDLTDVQKDKYKAILKKQYNDLKYTILNENINNDNAVVSVEIEVYDLNKVIEESNVYLDEHKEEFNTNDVYDKEKFWNYKLDRLSNVNERTKYILELTLTKIDNKWHLDDLLESDLKKIHGLYKSKI